jgi:hypothetical protein
MPYYHITIILKSGKYFQGIRCHPEYDPSQVRYVVEKKAYETIDRSLIDQIDVVPTAQTNTNLGL